MQLLLILTTLLTTTISKGLNQSQIDKQVTIYHEIDTNETIHYDVMLKEQKSIFNLTDRGAAIHLNLVHHNQIDGTYPRDTHVCSPVQHSIKFIETQDTFVQVVKEQKQEEQQYDEQTGTLGNTTQISNMVHIEGGVVILTEDLQIHAYAFKQKPNSTHYYAELKESIELDSIRKTENNDSLHAKNAHLAYQPKTKTVYVIFSDQIILVKVHLTSPNQKYIAGYIDLGNVLGTDLAIEAAVTSPNFLFITTEHDIYVYACMEDDGSLNFFEKINAASQIFPSKKLGEISVNLQDLAIGGKNGNLLYVLDFYNGIAIIEIDFKMSKNQPLYYSKLLQELGVIRVEGGFKLDQYNDESIIVLKEGLGAYRHHSAVEFNLDIHKQEWFQMRTYLLKGRSSDVDISKRIAVIRGVDAHRVIFHSVWEGFGPVRGQDTFYAPKLKHVDFFEKEYGKGNSNDWHFNQSHSFLFGVTNKQLIIYPWQEIDPSVRCYTEDPQDVDVTFLYTLTANTSDCDQKRQKNHSIPDLVMCSYEKDFRVRVSGRLLSGQYAKAYVLLIVLLSLFLISILSLIFYRQYRRYTIKRQALDREIQGFISKGYRLDDKENTEGQMSDSNL